MSTAIYKERESEYQNLPQEELHYEYPTGSLFSTDEIEAIITGVKKLQKSSRMVNITEGVMEVESNRFEAALQTEEGPKSIEGRLVKSYVSNDIQSGSSENWQFSIQEADHAIRFAYDYLPTKDAIKEIAKIWEQLEKTSELAAARSRLLVGKLPKPNLAPLPKWFEDQKPKLFECDEDEVTANPCAVSSAELLVRAAIANVPQAKNLVAEIEIGPMGRVIIDWCVPKGRLQWMIEALDVPWPSVKVYQLMYHEGPNVSKDMETRIMYNAFDAIDSFHQFLSSR